MLIILRIYYISSQVNNDIEHAHSEDERSR